jgi:hypothetical protein
VGADGSRVSSYNPWPSLDWLVSGKAVGGTPLFADDNKLFPLQLSCWPQACSLHRLIRWTPREQRDRVEA